MMFLLTFVILWISVSGGTDQPADSVNQEEVPSKIEDQKLENSKYGHKYENLALRGRATQSSIYKDGNYGYMAMAINAIDGNLNTNYHHGSCSHTNNDWSPWWRVDLLKSYRISHIIITNRQDCCAERLLGTEILVGDSLSDDGNNNPRCALVRIIPPGGSQTFYCHNMVGRYVNIILRGRKEYLHLCEVQVFGAAVH
ncbi:fucolectin-like [Anomaloglossus baeobatrachus]|uniref:fucolectin-like n=1 Tax=Anomaloglossus baeobatrachus TaxID=238106 RepID=UPI003F4F5512